MLPLQMMFQNYLSGELNCSDFHIAGCCSLELRIICDPCLAHDFVSHSDTITQRQISQRDRILSSVSILNARMTRMKLAEILKRSIQPSWIANNADARRVEWDHASFSTHLPCLIPSIRKRTTHSTSHAIPRCILFFSPRVLNQCSAPRQTFNIYHFRSFGPPEYELHPLRKH